MKHGRAAYFDFQSGSIIEKDSFEDSWKDKLQRLDTEGMNIAKEKLFALRKRFEGEEGLRFLRAVVTASGRTAWRLFAFALRNQQEYTVVDLQKNLLLRIEGALREITRQEKMAVA